MKIPIPDLMTDSIYDLTPELLSGMGIRLLALDLDNTLSPYHVHRPTVELRRWIRSMKLAGIEPFILSNNRSDRPGMFAAELDIGYVGKASKPFTRSLRQLMRDKGVGPGETALVGDQIYTDVLCAKSAGITAIAVRPIYIKNVFLALRYGAEWPFRAAYKRRYYSGT